MLPGSQPLSFPKSAMAAGAGLFSLPSDWLIFSPPAPLLKIYLITLSPSEQFRHLLKIILVATLISSATQLLSVVTQYNRRFN